MRQRFQNRVTAGRLTLPVVAVISVACWLLSPLQLPAAAVEHAGFWLNMLFGFLLYGVICYLLILFNNQFALIRIRASVQTSIYSLLVAVCPALHMLYAGNVATAFFLGALFLLFRSYREERSAGILFHAFVFVGLGSLFLPQLLLFIPMLWWGAYTFQSFTVKSFFASLLGCALPYWFLLGYAVCFDRMEVFCRPFTELAAFTPIDLSLEPWMWVSLGFLLLLYLVSTAHCLVVSYDDKIQTRCYLIFLIRFTFYAFVYIGLQSSMALPLLPLLLVGVSILTGHLFVLAAGRASNLFFIFVLAGLLALFAFNLFIN